MEDNIGEEEKSLLSCRVPPWVWRAKCALHMDPLPAEVHKKSITPLCGGNGKRTENDGNDASCCSDKGVVNTPPHEGGNYNRSGCDPPPSYLSKLAGGGELGRGGGRREGGGGGYWQLSWGGGGLRDTHYYHMHTSRVCVCLGAWGYRGMFAIIAISRLCQEESLRGLKDQRHSTPFN